MATLNTSPELKTQGKPIRTSREEHARMNRTKIARKPVPITPQMIRVVTPGREWHVLSRRLGVWPRIVTWDGSDYSCTCEHHTFRRALCKHIEAVSDLNAPEVAQVTPVEPVKPTKRRLTLEEIFDEPLTPTEVRRAAQYQRTFGR